MKQNQENNNISESANRDFSSERKIWETPKLRILPVPTKTQGGPFNNNDQDDIFYKKS